MKRRFFQSPLLLSILLLLSACSSPSSDTKQIPEISDNTREVDSSAVVTETTPTSRTAAPTNTPTIDAKRAAFYSFFPEIQLPYTVNLSGDTIDKAQGGRELKPSKAVMQEYLGIGFQEDTYNNHFISITPVGKVTSPNHTLLLYVMSTDGECLGLTAAVVPTTGTIQNLELAETACGPCDESTSQIIITKEKIVKKHTRAHNCGEEGEVTTKEFFEALYTYSQHGIQETQPSLGKK